MVGLPLQPCLETLRAKKWLAKDTNLDTKVGIFCRKNIIVFCKRLFYLWYLLRKDFRLSVVFCSVATWSPTTEQVDQLLALGNMSVLGISINNCLFYNRDTQESWGTAKPKLRNLQEICSEEWVYIWEGTQWLGSESSSFNLIPIQELLVSQFS